MYTLQVNGQNYRVSEDKSLLRFLRDDLRLTSVKDGCSEGVCGACTVIVGAKKFKSCLLKVSQVGERPVLTVEGIDPQELEIYVQAYAQAGAVQCGFCTPGLVMATKALLDSQPQPTQEEIKKALVGNICRCTGYQKIIEAVHLAAQWRLNPPAFPPPAQHLHLESHAPRLDVEAKVTGRALYTDDLHLEGMIYAQALFSPAPRALIKKIDCSAALAHPHCLRILRREDVPHPKIGVVKEDWDVLLGEGDITRYVGDALALVASDHPRYLEEILALIHLEYEELPPLTTPQEALAPGAPAIHPGGNLMSSATLVRGQAEEAIAQAPFKVTRRYTTPWQEHAFLEPECAVALPQGEGGLLIYCGCQSVYEIQRSCAQMLGLAEEKVRCHSPFVGGAFGGKEDVATQAHAALMAWYTGRPVKVKYSRQQSLDYHVKRHPMEIEITTACDERGYLVGLKAEILSDTGAYASLGGPILHRACTHIAGPYNYHNISVQGRAVYTNNVVSGAFRGFGVAQAAFASETNINLLAELVGLDPWQFRYQNAIRPGQVLPNGQLATPDTNIHSCLEAVRESFYAHPGAGLACAFKNSGIGMGRPDVGRVRLVVEGGRVQVRTSAACTGQGLAQAILTIICATSDLPPALFEFWEPDTQDTPDSGVSSASRQTVITGEAARRAALQLREALQGSDLSRLEGHQFYAEFAPPTDPLNSPKEYPTSHVSYSYAAQVVWLDEKGRVEGVHSAFDIGNPVNLPAAQGQIEGGIVMGLGYALTEEYKLQAGRPQTTLAKLGLWRAPQIPQMVTQFCRPQPDQALPWALGAKGCGELCVLPTAPACAHAYYRRDHLERLSLPLRPTFYKK